MQLYKAIKKNKKFCAHAIIANCWAYKSHLRKFSWQCQLQKVHEFFGSSRLQVTTNEFVLLFNKIQLWNELFDGSVYKPNINGVVTHFSGVTICLLENNGLSRKQGVNFTKYNGFAVKQINKLNKQSKQNKEKKTAVETWWKRSK